jgi:hypothetical protein
LMTSASCRTSVSAGVVSSAKAARMRAKFFDFGYEKSASARCSLRE